MRLYCSLIALILLVGCAADSYRIATVSGIRVYGQSKQVDVDRVLEVARSDSRIGEAIQWIEVKSSGEMWLFVGKSYGAHVYKAIRRNDTWEILNEDAPRIGEA